MNGRLFLAGALFVTSGAATFTAVALAVDESVAAGGECPAVVAPTTTDDPGLGGGEGNQGQGRREYDDHRTTGGNGITTNDREQTDHFCGDGCDASHGYDFGPDINKLIDGYDAAHDHDDDVVQPSAG